MRILGVVVTFAVVIAGLLVFGVIRWAGHQVADSSSPPKPAAFAVGGCVRVSVQPSVIRSVPNGPVLKSRAEYAAVGCSDKSAYAKITLLKTASLGGAISPNGGSAEDIGCPPDTDEIAVVKSNFDVSGRNACMRNLAAPHPGDPGQGGGLVRQGDCLQILNTYSDNVREVACTNTEWKVGGVSFGKEWFGQIVGRADTVAGCPASAMYSVTVRSGTGRVLCLAKNGGWLPAAGDCVDANLFNRTPARRPCTDKYLAMKITALVRPGRACPGGTRPTTVPGYLRRVCVKHVV
ncbi:LppU/SCO3897 family protein [Actinomadura scrupuli]|uniref:LppU/SCO3897 family protein n=1 Tax=Actinomadura scrupuli TaxID=559629 RepID=UPI003D98E3D6